MQVTNLSDSTFVLNRGIVIAPHAVGVTVAEALYNTDTTLNRQIEHLERAALITISGKPFPNPFPEAARTLVYQGETLDPSTFQGPLRTIDLVGPGLVYLKLDVTSFDTDGEPVDRNADPIVLWEVLSELSDDGVTWASAVGQLIRAQSNRYTGTDGFQTGDFVRLLYTTPRYLRVQGVILGSDPPLGDPGDGHYVGSKHPTFTYDLTLVPGTTTVAAA